MDVRSPEKDKKAGVLYAVTPDGVELPVVDVTNPAFAVEHDDGEVARLVDEFVRESRRRAWVPLVLQRAFLRVFLRRSVLARAIRGASGTFLDSLSTYLLKLGPDNLGAWAAPVDRTIAASLPVLAVRLRLQDMARLLADGLAPALASSREGRPVRLLNIAGGPAMDSLNALVLLHKEQPRLLAGRSVVVSVLDLHAAGPEFGARALEALRSRGGPLQGVDVRLEHVPYDWRDAATLRALLPRRGDGGALVAASSEGGLLEYATDHDAEANLAALATGPAEVAFVVGSVTRQDGPGVYLRQGMSRLATRPRTLDAFRALARRAGWDVDRVIERPFSYNVRLAKT